MHRSDWLPRTSWTLAALVWLAAGPLTLPLIGAIRCRPDHVMTADHMRHMPQPASHPQTPCYCDQMAAGMDGGLLLTPAAVPAVLPSAPGAEQRQVPTPRARAPRPVSHVPTPTPRPPIAQV